MRFLYELGAEEVHRQIDSSTVGYAVIERLDFMAECLALLVEETCGPKESHSQLSAPQESEEDLHSEV